MRIDRTNAAKSLLLTKPTMEEQHKGKKRLEKGSWEYNLVLKWIQSGAKGDVEATGEFDRLEITPAEIVLKHTGDTAQLRVLAHWKDGTVEDVTQITRFRSNDDSVATVSPTGVVAAKGKGDTHIVAFYDNGVLPVPVMLPVSDQTGASYPKVATATKVDALVVAKLRKLGIVPSEVCTDAEFLRRVTIDVTGGLPTPEQVTKFLADPSGNKRSAKIEELLKTPAYAGWMATKMSDYLGNNPAQLRGQGANGNFGPKYSRQWYDWLYARLQKNEPYDQMMAGVVLATGRTRTDQTYEEFAREMGSYFRKENPVNFADRPNMPYFWQRANVKKAEEKALAFAYSFLGVRIECAQCHKHPFDQWTQSDFVKFQAFFGGIEVGSRAAKEEKVTFASLTKDLKDAVPADPKGGNNQKQLGSEFDKRVAAGELVPWQEVLISNKSGGKGAAKGQVQVKGKNADTVGRVLTPKILGGEEVLLNEFPDPRVPLMQWLRSSKNPYFSRSFVNRVWAGYFGRGLVEPADDMNLANPPVNRELMDYLAEGFAAHGYDMAWLHREILTSDTYQRSWKPNATNLQDEKNFSRMVPRRLPAEVAMDAVTQATLASDRLTKFVGDIENRAIGPNSNAGQRKGGGVSASARGKSAIFVRLGGGPSHMDSFDLKPDAPDTHRGEFKEIATNVPGMSISEHLPLLAKCADKYVILRGVSHTLAAHELGTTYMNTGNRPLPSLNYPHYGAVVAKELQAAEYLPPFVAIPSLGAKATGYLGVEYGPFETGGSPTPGKALEVRGMALRTGVTLEYLDRRQNLVQRYDTAFGDYAKSDKLLQGMDQFGQKAYAMMRSSKAREAFDLSQESANITKMFGKESFSQSCAAPG